MRSLLFLIALISLVGCRTPEPVDPVVDPSATVEFLQAGLRPEVMLFPEYLLMEDFELNLHGRVPESTLVGAGMRTKLGLSVARGRFNDELSDKGWTIDKVEIEKNAFRLQASLEEARLEIRGVRGTGDTLVFLMYEPDPANAPRVF